MNTENRDMMETCIRCGKETEVPVGMPVEKREYFVEGSGQLCKECYEEVYGEEDYRILAETLADNSKEKRVL